MRAWSTAGLIILLCLIALPAWGETAYVIDELVVTVRATPNQGGAVVDRVSSLQKIWTLESEGDWTKVRTPSGAEGWMPTKYLTAAQPAALRVSQLEETNRELTAQLERLKTEREQLTQSLKTADGRLEASRQDLQAAQKERDDLAQTSGDVVKLRDDYRRARAELESLQQEVAELRVKADESATSRRLQWFMAGGGVLVAGWLAGLISGRRRRRTPSLY